MDAIQDAEDLWEFNRLLHDKVDRIVKESPGSIIDIMASVIENLCNKIGVTEEETRQCVRVS